MGGEENETNEMNEVNNTKIAVIEEDIQENTPGGTEDKTEPSNKESTDQQPLEEEFSSESESDDTEPRTSEDETPLNFPKSTSSVESSPNFESSEEESSKDSGDTQEDRKNATGTSSPEDGLDAEKYPVSQNSPPTLNTKDQVLPDKSLSTQQKPESGQM